MAQAALELQDVKRYFGAVRAVDGVSFTVQPGEIRAIIGPNGAGKSTLLSMIAGRERPTHGRIVFDGQPITGLKAYQVFRRGIVPTFQVARFFQEMSVLENVQVAVLARQGKILHPMPAVEGMTEVREESEEILDRVGLGPLARTPSSTLAHGDRKRLELAIALAGRPKVLLLDEPTAGMSLAERTATVDLLERLSRDLRITVLFTEHDMDVVFRWADLITVMHQGRVIASGPPSAVRADERVRAAYLGKGGGGHAGD